MIGSSESQSAPQIERELRDIKRRVDYLDRQAKGAEERVEALKRHQLNYALRPNYGGGKVGHGAKTLTGLAVMQRMRSNEERTVEDLHQRRSNLESHAQHKEEQLQRQREREREEAEQRREERARGEEPRSERDREVRDRMERHSTSSPQPYAQQSPQRRPGAKREGSRRPDPARERDADEGRDFI